MLDGKNVWNPWYQKGMGDLCINGRTVYSFPDMRKSFYELLQDTARRYPDKVGICDNWNHSLSWSSFLQRVDELAAWLKYVERVEKGDHIGLLLNNGIEFAAAFYAVCKLGAVAVPLPTKYREPELRSLIGKADLKGLLASEDYGWAASCREQQIFVLFTENEKGHYGFEALFQTEEWKECPPDAPAEPGVGELGDEVILMFTSGTTSGSRGVILKNYNTVHAVMVYQRLLGLEPEDRTIIPVPIYHVTGLIALLGLFVYIGGTVYLYKRYDARRILKGVAEHGITFMHGSPTVFGLLLEHQREFPDLPSIRTLACGSSYMPVETMRKLHRWMPQMEFRNVYGMTETSSPATMFPYDAATSIYPGSEGKPVPGVQIRILDENGRELPNGEVGIVHLKGACICEYYYKLDSPLISDDGWLDTGDMGYINEDSYVYIVDRKKDMINRGGEKIWCTDVEEALTSVPGVRDAAVVGIPNEKYGECAAAVVVLEDGIIMTEDELKEQLGHSLARYKIPVKILFLPAVPKTPGLKTDKKYIRTLF